MFKIFSKHRKTLFKINNENRTKKITDVSLSVFIFDLEQLKEVTVISGPSFSSMDGKKIICIQYFPGSDVSSGILIPQMR